MLSDLIKVRDKVKHILELVPAARDSDKILWLAYNERFTDIELHIGKMSSFRAWLLSNDVPTFESLSRARRKVQELYPELQGQLRSKRKEEAELIREHFSKN